MNLLAEENQLVLTISQWIIINKIRGASVTHILSNNNIMRTATGVLSASIAMLTDKPLIQGVFFLITFYLIYKELKSDERNSK
jgi:hypothetical protein